MLARLSLKYMGYSIVKRYHTLYIRWLYIHTQLNLLVYIKCTILEEEIEHAHFQLGITVFSTHS